MKPRPILKEGDTVVLKLDGNKHPFYTAEGVFEVNVQVVDAMDKDLYRVKPISGHGCKVVSITNLFLLDLKPEKYFKIYHFFNTEVCYGSQIFKQSPGPDLLRIDGHG